MKIFVTGATGFIGSHTCVELLKSGYEVVGVDNFGNSKPQVLEYIKMITGKSIEFYEGDVRDTVIMERIFSEHKIDCVIHFAGLKAVGESVEKPLLYYNNNLVSTLTLSETMQRHGVKKIIFSSSATVYGIPATCPITEEFPLSTLNPYGATKLMTERILTDATVADSSLSVVLLRYFNPIGAHESGLIGEEPNGIPNNLMPYILKVASGEYPHLRVFGNDYPTPDGTGVRDYIHVVDLAIGHVRAIEQAVRDTGVHIYNLGTGNGYSVLDLVRHFERETGVRIPYELAPRRAGDAPTCYADATKAWRELGWKAEREIGEMCRDAWRFVQPKQLV